MSDIESIMKCASGDGLEISEELLPLVYDELRSLASKQMCNERSGLTLQATALVHEAWIKLTKNGDQSWQNRRHFFRAAAQAMRRILIDRARSKSSQKNGARSIHLDIHDFDIADESQDERILLVDEALKQLEGTDPVSARIITLKFFGGLTNREIAKMDEVSERTVERQWAYARVCLYRMIVEDISSK